MRRHSIDTSINVDEQKLSSCLLNVMHELEALDVTNDRDDGRYELYLEVLESSAKLAYLEKNISKKEWYDIVEKYGGIPT